MNTHAARGGIYRLPPDRFGSMPIRTPDRRSHDTESTGERRAANKRIAGRKAVIVAMMVGAIIVAVVIAIKVIRFVVFYP